MKKIRISALLLATVLLFLSFAGCKKPIPPEQLAIDVYNSALATEVKDTGRLTNVKITMKLTSDDGSIEVKMNGYESERYDENGNVTAMKRFQEISSYDEKMEQTTVFADGKYYFSDGTNMYMSSCTLDEYRAKEAEKTVGMQDIKPEDFNLRNCTKDKETGEYTVELSEPNDNALNAIKQGFGNAVELMIPMSKATDLTMKLKTDSNKVPLSVDMTIKFQGTSDYADSSIEISATQEYEISESIEVLAPADAENYKDVGDAIAFEKVTAALTTAYSRTEGKINRTVEADIEDIYGSSMYVQDQCKYSADSGFYFEIVGEELIKSESIRSTEYVMKYSNGTMLIQYNGTSETRQWDDSTAAQFFFMQAMSELVCLPENVNKVSVKEEGTNTVYKIEYTNEWIESHSENAPEMFGLTSKDVSNYSYSPNGEQTVTLDKDGNLIKLVLSINTRFTYYGENVAVVRTVTVDIPPQSEVQA